MAPRIYFDLDNIRENANRLRNIDEKYKELLFELDRTMSSLEINWQSKEQVYFLSDFQAIRSNMAKSESDLLELYVKLLKVIEQFEMTDR